MNLTKFVLHFSDFSTVLYAIYKKQQEHFYYFRSTLRQGPWKERESYPNAPGLHSDPQKELALCNQIPRGGRRRSGRKFRQGPGQVRSGTAGKWSKGH
jgi:hypothetical protein